VETIFEHYYSIKIPPVGVGVTIILNFVAMFFKNADSYLLLIAYYIGDFFLSN